MSTERPASGTRGSTGTERKISYRPAAVVAGLAAGVAVTALVVTLVAGGAVAEKVIPGLGDAGAITRWGLPIARLAMDLAAVLTVGALLLSSVLLPQQVPGTRTRAGRDGDGRAAAADAAAAGAADAADATGTTDGTTGTGTTGTGAVDAATAGTATDATVTDGMLTDAAVTDGTATDATAGEGAADARRVAGRTGALSAVAIQYVRAASWLAAVWAAAAGATLVFTVSDILGEPAGQVVSGGRLSSYAGQLPQGTALLLVIIIAVVISLLARTTVMAGGALGLLVLALVALLPPPLTGHSAAAANHSLAITALAMHIVALSLWVGGLIAVALHVWWRSGDGAAVAAERFSRMALWCYVMVGVSGLANAISRLPDPAELVTSPYGRLVLAKIAAFGVLGLMGRWHRERTLKDLAAGRPRAFTRLAVAEAAVMAATMGLAVGLARTAPPVTAAIDTTVKALIGYDMPPAATFGRLVALWRLDFFFAVLVVVLGGLYLAGVVRLRRRGDSWPAGRTAAWFAGLLTIVLVTQSGVATYAPILFSIHMIQHMVLGMLTPIFLVLGAPMTLALRALKPARLRGDRGPREWIILFLHSKVGRFYAHPLVATLLFVASTYALYFTPLYGAAMRSHIGHIAMLVHFLAAGTLFFWLIIGVDPAPRRLPPTGRLLVLFLTMPFHAFFGIALMNLSEPIAAGWYAALSHPWGTSVLTDEHTGGSIAWAFGEIPTFIVLVALVFQWFMEDQRTARRRDRQSDRAVAENRPDELAEYNEYLAALEQRSRGARG